MYDNIDYQTDSRRDDAAENESRRGAEYHGDPGISFLAYVMSSAGSTGVQVTFRVRLCEMTNPEVEGAMFAGDFDPADPAPVELLATNVGTARPGVAVGDNPGTPVVVHKVGARFAFDYRGG